MQTESLTLADYAGQCVVVKVGGAAMSDPAFLDRVGASLAALVEGGVFPVVVHGGGPEINAFSDRLGIKPRFVKGRRVTDEATLGAVQLVLCGKTNKQVVGALAKAGIAAVGLSGLDANLLLAKRIDEDLGFVGLVTEVNVPLLHLLLHNGYVPVIAPLSRGEDGHAYNVNADEAAAAVAQALEAKAFVLLTDVDGLYADYPDPHSLVTRMTTHEAERFVQDGKVTVGMGPKVSASVQASHGGVAVVVMANGNVARPVERALCGDIGTRVVRP